MDAGVSEEEDDRLERRVSWIPGAEGAPFDEGGCEEDVERLFVDAGWEDGGTMWKDWWG